MKRKLFYTIFAAVCSLFLINNNCETKGAYASGTYGDEGNSLVYLNPIQNEGEEFGSDRISNVLLFDTISDLPEYKYSYSRHVEFVNYAFNHVSFKFHTNEPFDYASITVIEFKDEIKVEEEKYKIDSVKTPLYTREVNWDGYLKPGYYHFKISGYYNDDSYIKRNGNYFADNVSIVIMHPYFNEPCLREMTPNLTPLIVRNDLWPFGQLNPFSNENFLIGQLLLEDEAANAYLEYEKNKGKAEMEKFFSLIEEGDGNAAIDRFLKVYNTMPFADNKDISNLKFLSFKSIMEMIGHDYSSDYDNCAFFDPLPISKMALHLFLNYDELTLFDLYLTKNSDVGVLRDTFKGMNNFKEDTKFVLCQEFQNEYNDSVTLTFSPSKVGLLGDPIANGLPFSINTTYTMAEIIKEFFGNFLVYLPSESTNAPSYEGKTVFDQEKKQFTYYINEIEKYLNESPAPLYKESLRFRKKIVLNHELFNAFRTIDFNADYSKPFEIEHVKWDEKISRRNGSFSNNFFKLCDDNSIKTVFENEHNLSYNPFVLPKSYDEKSNNVSIDYAGDFEQIEFIADDSATYEFYSELETDSVFNPDAELLTRLSNDDLKGYVIDKDSDSLDGINFYLKKELKKGEKIYLKVFGHSYTSTGKCNVVIKPINGTFVDNINVLDGKKLLSIQENFKNKKRISKRFKTEDDGTYIFQTLGNVDTVVSMKEIDRNGNITLMNKDRADNDNGIKGENELVCLNLKFDCTYVLDVCTFNDCYSEEDFCLLVTPVFKEYASASDFLNFKSKNYTVYNGFAFSSTLKDVNVGLFLSELNSEVTFDVKESTVKECSVSLLNIYTGELLKPTYVDKTDNKDACTFNLRKDELYFVFIETTAPKDRAIRLSINYGSNFLDEKKIARGLDFVEYTDYLNPGQVLEFNLSSWGEKEFQTFGQIDTRMMLYKRMSDGMLKPLLDYDDCDCGFGNGNEMFSYYIDANERYGDYLLRVWAYNIRTCGYVNVLISETNCMYDCMEEYSCLEANSNRYYGWDGVIETSEYSENDEIIYVLDSTDTICVDHEEFQISINVFDVENGLYINPISIITKNYKEKLALKLNGQRKYLVLMNIYGREQATISLKITTANDINSNNRYFEDSAYVDKAGYKDYYLCFENEGYKTFQTFSNSDTRMYLYDQKDNLLFSNDDSGYNLNALFSYSVKKNEVYKLRVKFYSSGVSGKIKTAIIPVDSYNAYSNYDDFSEFYTGLNSFRTIQGTSGVARFIPSTGGKYSFTTSYRNSSFNGRNMLDTYLYVIDPSSSDLLTSQSYNDNGCVNDWNQAYLAKTLESNKPYFIILTGKNPMIDYGVLTVRIQKIS